MKSLLKAKHWQLFLFVYGLPLLYTIVLLCYMVQSIIKNNAFGVDVISNYSKFSLLFVIIPVLLLLCWFWSVVEGLNNKLRNELKLRTSKLKISIMILASYTVTISIFILMVMNSWDHDKIFYTSLSNEVYIYILTIFFILNILILFCLLFSIHLVAKIIKTTELQKKVNFSDYVGEFILIWLFPIGVWFIQPRINNLIKK